MDNTQVIDVKALRERLGLTQEQLAEELGVHWRTIQNWEGGQAIPKSKHTKLCNMNTSILSGDSKYNVNQSGNGGNFSKINVHGDDESHALSDKIAALEKEVEMLKLMLENEKERSQQYWELIKELKK